MEKGILTIAQGKKDYIDLAVALAISLKLKCPGLPIALVTDSNDPELKNHFDLIIPVDPAFGSGYEQKLHAYEYSVFSRTMLIDADCLVNRDFSFLWEEFRGKPVSVIGKRVYNGALVGTTVEELKEKMPLSYLLSFNGGVYYFEKSDIAAKIFGTAQDIFRTQYDKLGLCKFNGKPGDEPAMSVAMGLYNVEPVDDHGKGMYTPVGQNGVFEMDILKGYCSFIKNGVKVSPAIMHFGFGHTKAFHYRRELLKLKLGRFLPAALASMLVNGMFNPSYILYVFTYRVCKTLFKGARFKLFPLMPMFRFE